MAGTSASMAIKFAVAPFSWRADPNTILRLRAQRAGFRRIFAARVLNVDAKGFGKVLGGETFEASTRRRALAARVRIRRVGADERETLGKEASRPRSSRLCSSLRPFSRLLRAGVDTFFAMQLPPSQGYRLSFGSANQPERMRSHRSSISSEERASATARQAIGRKVFADRHLDVEAARERFVR